MNSIENQIINQPAVLFFILLLNLLLLIELAYLIRVWIVFTACRKSIFAR